MVVPGKQTEGWVTFEVPQITSVELLQIRYEYNGKLSTKWIPLWPLVSNIEESKKIHKALYQKKPKSLSNKRDLVIVKILDAINDYNKYCTTGNSKYVVNGIKNASHAKLLYKLDEKNHCDSKNKRHAELSYLLTAMNTILPEKLIQQNPQLNRRLVSYYLHKMRKYLDSRINTTGYSKI